MNQYWQQLMQLCATRFAIQPCEFWKLTVPELDALFQAVVSTNDGEFPDRQMLERLMRHYPDHDVGKGKSQQEDTP